jgi:hypothetical protein
MKNIRFFVTLYDPILGDSLQSPRIFSYRLSKGRRVVESALGILAGKWRIFNKPIETSSDMAVKTVQFVCVLYNTDIDREGLNQASVL